MRLILYQTLVHKKDFHDSICPLPTDIHAFKRGPWDGLRIGKMQNAVGEHFFRLKVSINEFYKL